ncbi:MAG: hypothetical protein ABIJ84_00980 [bacterium]
MNKSKKIFFACLAISVLFLAFTVLAQDNQESYFISAAQPKITAIKESFLNLSGLLVQGQASPYFNVVVSLKDSKENLIYSFEAIANGDGKWSGKFDQPLKSGKYYFEAVAQNNNGDYSYPVKSDFINVQGPFAIIIGGLSIIVAILTFAFTAGWYVSKWAEGKRYRRILLSERDVASSYSVIKNDVLRALKSISEVEPAFSKASEVKFLLERVVDNLEKMNKYVTQSVRKIGKYDIVKKIDKQ